MLYVHIFVLTRSHLVIQFSSYVTTNHLSRVPRIRTVGALELGPKTSYVTFEAISRLFLFLYYDYKAT